MAVPNVKNHAGVEVDAQHPLNFGSLDIAANQESDWLDFTIDTTGLTVQGDITVTAVDLSGADSAPLFQYAPDNAGVPGTPGAYGTPLTLSGSARKGWVRRKAGSSESAGTDTTAVIRVSVPVQFTISGSLSAVAGANQVTLSGPSAQPAGIVAKWQYNVDGGSYTDIPNSANNTMPSYVVLNQTAQQHIYGVRAVDAAGNASSAVTATATPTSFTEGFESVTPPALPSGWTDKDSTGATLTGWVSVAMGLNNSSKAVRCTTRNANGGTSTQTEFLIPLTQPQNASSGRFVATLKSGVCATGKRFGALMLKSGGVTGSAAAQVAIKDNTINVVHNGNWLSTPLVSGIADNTEFDLEIVWGVSAGKFDVRVDGTLYNNGGNHYQHLASNPPTTVDFAAIDAYPGGYATTAPNEYVYADDIGWSA